MSRQPIGQLSVAAIGCLLLCSCNAVPARRTLDEAFAAGSTPPAAIHEFCAGGSCPVLPDEMMMACNAPEPPPLPYCASAGYCAPDCPGQCPPGEYLCDGGDQQPAVEIGPEMQTQGLNVEDTVAEFDTISCGRKVQPSNCVCLYAPRFGSVRKIIHPLLNEQVDSPVGVEQPEAAMRYAKLQEPTTTLQNIPAQVGIARRKAAGIKVNAWPDVGTVILAPEAVQDLIGPYADLLVIHSGKFRQADKPYLATAIAAAITWTNIEGVSVQLGGQAANEIVGDQRAEAVYSVKNVPGCPMLRVIKVASTQAANPGETVDFTIRFDNVGTEMLGNVTILDNLTTRLEYVPESAQSSVKAKFATQPNQADSLILQWNIEDPLEPGEGGIVRFTCRVR